MKIIIFFFSSRRRHTRSDRDWSSDVCSSDLGAAVGALAREVVSSTDVGLPLAPEGVAALRSEERRVGKECRSRWSPYHSKKKRTVIASGLAKAERPRRALQSGGHLHPD